ncbi:MAG: valine--tRNA ligase [Oscillospiraceae bacterium]|nr:valine--tRNA ligase [Oscillospiraceae bacterium]
MTELAKTYEPQSTEGRIYELWERSGGFRAEVNKKKKPFSVAIPPPNVTGQLHLGHAFDNTLQDILVRFRRMQGYCAVWVPGTDHAGIATEAVVAKRLLEEGLSRQQLGREAFIEKVWEWKEQYGGRIVGQLKRIGSSCDWSRLRFTMDTGCSEAVREVFVRLYEKGLIYRGSRIINRCPECATALSDAEVEYTERAGHLWHIAYPLSDGGGSLVVATTRPETMLGDVAVAVHPDDERYKAHIGKTVRLPLQGRDIPVIADGYVDMSFGTGCLKITPAHDPNDYEVALRHNLPRPLVLNEKAAVNERGGKYCGMSREQAREAVLRDLEGEGLLVRTEDHTHSVGSCYRCGTTVEPMDSEQWFVKMEPLAKPAVKAVKDGRVTFVPKRFAKVYMNWMNGVRDWCISRQLWWGHRIPAWHCPCGHITVGREDPAVCGKCGNAAIERDADVLDTWFSSALWPFSVFGWPQDTDDLRYFYPTSVVVPGYDILFFWVARMVFSGLEHTGDVPFRTVYLHGLIRDAQGKKMSKSAGNGVDPLDVIGQYGADALRMYIISGNAAGADIRFSAEKCGAMRNFANKLWNAARFVIMRSEPEAWSFPDKLELSDMWILTKLNNLIPEVTENMEKYELGIAAQKLYDFVWSDFCDWYIELTKPRLQAVPKQDSGIVAEQMLCHTLMNILKLLHPFMPFITEEIWQALPCERDKDILMLESWPKPEGRLIFNAECRAMEQIMELITAIRAQRAELGIPPSKRSAMYVVSDIDCDKEQLELYLQKSAFASEVTVVKKPPQGKGRLLRCVTGSAAAYLPAEGLVDIEVERQKLLVALAGAKEEAKALRKKLANEAFLAKAPPEIVEKEREKLAASRRLARKLTAGVKAYEASVE